MGRQQSRTHQVSLTGQGPNPACQGFDCVTGQMWFFSRTKPFFRRLASLPGASGRTSSCMTHRRMAAGEVREHRQWGPTGTHQLALSGWCWASQGGKPWALWFSVRASALIGTAPLSSLPHLPTHFGRLKGGWGQLINAIKWVIADAQSIPWAHGSALFTCHGPCRDEWVQSRAQIWHTTGWQASGMVLHWAPS